LQAGTVNAAELMGWSDRVGSIRTGKLADMVAVKGNPLFEVRLLEHIQFVMKDGVVYKDEISSAVVAPLRESQEKPK
jgi:imidazolonepropionase-like amidohydrolase